MLWGLINGLHQLHIDITVPDPTKLCDTRKPGSIPGLSSLTAEQHSHIKAWITHFHVFSLLQVTHRNQETQI